VGGNVLPHRENVERIVVIVHRQPELLQVVLALRPARGLAGLLHGGKQQRDQDRDDRDHDEQFDQRERTRSGSVTEIYGQYDALT
jgi:hypothetical protein